MKKNALIIGGIFFIVVGLTAITIWRIKKWEDIKKEPPSELGTLGLQNLNEQLGKFFPAPDESPQEFVSPDGKLKMQYPANLFGLEDQKNLEALVPENLAKEYRLKILFLASDSISKNSNFLVIYGGELGPDIPTVIEKIKEINQKQGLIMELTSSDLLEKKGVFEARYQGQAGDIFLSKEKILVNEGNEIYLVSFFAPPEEWPKLPYDIDKIIENATIDR